jgi:hypothetical protein
LVAEGLRREFILEERPRAVHAAGFHAALPASLLEQFKDPDFPLQLVALLHFLTGLSEGGLKLDEQSQTSKRTWTV